MVKEINIEKFKENYLKKDGYPDTILSEIIKKVRQKEASQIDLYNFCRIPYNILIGKELIKKVDDIKERIEGIIHFTKRLEDSNPEIQIEASDYLKSFIPAFEEELKKLKEIAKTNIELQPPISSMSEYSGFKIVRSKRCLGLNQVKIFDALILLAHKYNYELIKDLVNSNVENIDPSLYIQKIRVLLKSNDQDRNKKSLLTYLKSKSNLKLSMIPGGEKETLAALRLMFPIIPFIRLETDPNGDEYVSINAIIFKTIYSVMYEYLGLNHIKTREAVTNFFLWLWANSLEEDDREITTNKIIIIFTSFFLKNLVIENDEVFININNVSIEDEENIKGLAEISTELIQAFEGPNYRINENDVKVWLKIFHERTSNLYGVGDIRVDIHPRTKELILRYEKDSSQFSYLPLMKVEFHRFIKGNNSLKDMLKFGNVSGAW